MSLNPFHISNVSRKTVKVSPRSLLGICDTSIAIPATAKPENNSKQWTIIYFFYNNSTANPKCITEQTVSLGQTVVV